MQPVDFSGRELIRLWTRGMGDKYSAMLVAGPDPRAAAPCGVRCARGVDPGGDPAGGLPNGRAGDHCRAGVCGRGATRGVESELDDLAIR